MNSLKQLQDCGQSIWLDYIRRDLITSGEFQRLVEEDGVHGVTSNPTIFDKASAAGTTYDDALRLLLSADPDRDALTLFENLEIEDLQVAADILLPVYDQTNGSDGFVSIEVSPRLAYDTAGSIAEAQRPLWASTGTKNPTFSDVLYVEELIGPHTINTIPPATLNAFRDHGRVQPTLEAGEQDAEHALARLAKLGIDLGAITENLLADGITAFTHSLDELLSSLKEKRRVLLESQAARKGGIRNARVA